MPLYDAQAHGQTDAGAASHRLGREVEIENTVPDVGGYVGTGIGDANLD